MPSFYSMIFSSIISCFPHPRFPLSSAQSCQRDLTLSQVLLHCCSHLLDRYWHTNAGCILYLENNTRGSSLLMPLMMQCRCALCSQLFFFSQKQKSCSRNSYCQLNKNPEGRCFMIMISEIIILS